MRNDFKKVLTERARDASARGYREVRAREARHDSEGLPAIQGMRRPYIGHYGSDAKESNYLFGPIRRFLASRLGRRWDDVWSELCRSIDASTNAGHHLRDYVQWMVEREPVAAERLASHGSCSREFYMDALGILCRAEWCPPKRWHQEQVIMDGIGYLQQGRILVEQEARYGRPVPVPARDLARFVLVHGRHEGVRVDGVWYWVVFREVSPPSKAPNESGADSVPRPGPERTDFVTQQRVGQEPYRADKRQMSSRDLARHGLSNVALRAQRGE